MQSALGRASTLDKTAYKSNEINRVYEYTCTYFDLTHVLLVVCTGIDMYEIKAYT